MKGTLNKIQLKDAVTGRLDIVWFVRYGDMQFIPLLQIYQDNWGENEDVLEGTEVEFEIVKLYDDDDGNEYCYAKILKYKEKRTFIDIRADKLETLARLLAKSWFYGNFKWENPNERVMQMIMQDLGLYPFKDEDEMIQQTKVDEEMYKQSIVEVPTRKSVKRCPYVCTIMCTCEGECLNRIFAPMAIQSLSEITENTSDGYHTFKELYEFRKAYNVALFNQWGQMAQGKFDEEMRIIDFKPKYDVHKSWKHNDGELCFGGGWFIVVAVLPDGQISNHYKAEDWDLFKIPEVEIAKYPFDGHTSQDVINRLLNIKL